MSDYDFQTLNDKEFEILCVDLLWAHLGRRFERFKPGRDAGVDGRYLKANGTEEILQCKHWANTPFATLIRSLSDVERPKLEKLAPTRYIICVTNSLSRNDKRKISNALGPLVNLDSDIYGKEDLNDLLKRHPDVERRHYKLWLQTSSVLTHILNASIFGRSEFTLAEALAHSAKYAVTASHARALKILNEKGVLVISGDPGVGKTTLADHLALQFVAQDFSYVRISDDIREAESVFDRESKQIFYFDDFLGRNYLDALRGHEGSKISMFVRRVASNKNKRFILTSRSTILNQGRILNDSFEHVNLAQSEYELRISGLAEIDRAHILYNHIWHSGLGAEFIDQIYEEKRYKKIVSHRNFNPRLISYITDATRLQDISAPKYWSYIQRSLADPSHIWENPFVAQLDSAGRAIVLLVVLNGRPISEVHLSEAYGRLVAAAGGQAWTGSMDFLSYIRLLTGSFLTRSVQSGFAATLDLFNPSIGDYVLRRYAGDGNSLRQALTSLRSITALNTLESLRKVTGASPSMLDGIARALLLDASANGFFDLSVNYVSSLCETILTQSMRDSSIDMALKLAVSYVFDNRAESYSGHSFNVVGWGYSQGLLKVDDVLEFIDETLENVTIDDEFKSVALLLSVLPADADNLQVVYDRFKEQIVEVLSDDLDSFIEVSDALANVNWAEYREAERELAKEIERRLSECGVKLSGSQTASIVDSFDVRNALDSYIMNASDGDRDEESAPQAPQIDQIDDLFDRDGR